MRLTSASPLNQCWFRQLSRNLPLRPSTKAFWVGLPGWMKFSAAPDRSLQKRIALLAGSGPLSQTTALGAAAALPSPAGKSASRAPVIEVATSWPTHSLEKPAATSGMRKRRPLASWSDMKSIDQRSFGRVGAAIRTRGGRLRRLARTCRPSREQARRLRLRVATKPSRFSHVVQRQVTVAGAPPGQLSQAVRQRPVAALRIRTAPGRRAVEPQQAAGPPLAGRMGLPEAARRLPLGGGRHHFFDISMTSSSIRMSRLRSATMRFRRRPPLEPLQVGHGHASVLGFPAVDRPLGDAMLAGQVGRRGAGLAFVEDRDGLFFRVSLAFHAMPSLGSGWRENSPLRMDLFMGERSKSQCHAGQAREECRPDK